MNWLTDQVMFIILVVLLVWEIGSLHATLVRISRQLAQIHGTLQESLGEQIAANEGGEA